MCMCLFGAGGSNGVVTIAVVIVCVVVVVAVLVLVAVLTGTVYSKMHSRRSKDTVAVETHNGYPSKIECQLYYKIIHYSLLFGENA